jgi:hypothetical protein
VSSRKTGKPRKREVMVEEEKKPRGEEKGRDAQKLA